MKLRKISKALERSAREIKNSDEFVAHVANIAERYRREHALDAGVRTSELRQAYKDFRKHAGALVEWIEAAHRERQPAAQRDALDQLGLSLDGSTHAARAASKAVAEWLARADTAASACLQELQRSARKQQPTAPRIAADALRATFEHHHLKVVGAGTDGSPSPPVKLLCAVARAAGDASLSVTDARAAWKGKERAGAPKERKQSQRSSKRSSKRRR